GPDGKMYVADMVNSQVYKYNLAGGEPLVGWTGQKGGFNNVGGVAVDQDGMVYAADTGALAVQQLDPAGRFLQAYDLECVPRQMAVQGDWVDVICDKGLWSINRTGRYAP